jgi:hypothetical protein
MILGAVVAILGIFLLAGAFGFFFGAWGEGATGWRGMQIGLINLMGITFMPLFPNVALAGAALGLVSWTGCRLWGSHPQNQNITQAIKHDPRA